MAEESTDSLLLTPEKNELDSLDTRKNSSEYWLNTPHDRASTGISLKLGDSRSISTEISQSVNRKKFPSYLRASTGSCHDLCKYGGKHNFEEKARSPQQNRIAKMPPTEQNGVGKNSPGFQPSLDIKFVSAKLPSLDRIPVSSRKNGSSGNKIPSSKHNISPCKKTPSPGPPEVIKRETLLPSRNSEAPIEHGSFSDIEMLATEKKTGCLTEKHSTVHLKSGGDKMKSPSESSNDICGTLRRNSDVMPVKRATEIKISAQKATAPLSSNSSSKISLSKPTSTQSRKDSNSVPLPNHQNKIHRTTAKTSINEQVPGKTLHVMKTRSNAEAPPFPTRKDVDRATNKSFLDKIKLVKNGKAPTLTQNVNKTLRKSRMTVSDDKYRSPVKLKFKSGKVVDIQSDNNTSRKLKFRRARTNPTNVGISSVKVVLKHRDVQGRKHAQGLLNNVIEETASKLVESKKSKVKALVGAFETVISLQDRKPSWHTVESK